MDKQSKVPEYTKRAIKKYKESKERLYLLLETGTKDRIKKKYGADVSINGYIKGLIENDLGDVKTNNNLPWEN